MKLINHILVIGVAVITLYSEGLAGDLIQTANSGSINWSKGIITVQAKEVETAYQNMWEVIEELRINNEQQLGELVNHNQNLRIQLQQLIEKIRAVAERDLTSGQPIIKLQLSLKGAFIEALLATQPTYSVGRRPARFGRPASPPGSNGPLFIREVTGLVIDARGLKVVPAITPQIISAAGQLIYGLKSVNRSYMANQGLLEYLPDMAAAQASKRVADNPVLVKALAVDPEDGTDLIISNQDAERIMRIAKKHDFLYKCRVIIVLDQAANQYGN
jgi:hypothetical protein